MADFNIFDHISRAGLGQKTEQPTGDGIANEKESPEIVVEGINKVPGTVAKLMEGIPIIGPLLAALMPLNAGQISAVSALETQGIAGKAINPGKGGLTGGTLYNSLFAPLIKNSAITDQTGGTGGGGGGDTGAMAGGGGGGDFSGGGGGFIDSHSHFEGMASASQSYDWSNISWASLGGLPRPALPDMSSGPDLGVA